MKEERKNKWENNITMTKFFFLIWQFIFCQDDEPNLQMFHCSMVSDEFIF